MARVPLIQEQDHPEFAEVIEKYRSGELKDEERYYNLKWMQREVLK